MNVKSFAKITDENLAFFLEKIYNKTEENFGQMVEEVFMLAHTGTREILTDRLTLRRFLLSDAEQMFQNYAADGRVTRFLTWEPYKSVEDVRVF